MPNLIVPTNPLFIDNELKTPKFYLGTFYKTRGTYVTRYKCKTENRNFDLYIPNILVESVSNDYPENILISVSISSITPKPIGFVPKESQPLYRDRNMWEYEYKVEKGQTFQYEIMVDNEPPYKIYLPKSEFFKRPIPKRLLLSVHEFSQITKEYLYKE